MSVTLTVVLAMYVNVLVLICKLFCSNNTQGIVVDASHKHVVVDMRRFSARTSFMDGFPSVSQW